MSNRRDVYTSLMYHEIVDQKITKCSVTSEYFRKQMEALRNAGVCSYDLGGDNDTPEGYFCLLTFDDGHKSNLEAARLLSEMGFKGYFYLIKDYSISNSEYLNEDAIREIAKMGHGIGVHGKDHGHWSKKEPCKLVAELRETKDWIEQITGKEVITCSAPGGVIDQRTIDNIKNEIPELKYIRTSCYGVNNEGDTVLKSIGVLSNYSTGKVLRIAQNDYWEMKKIMTYYYVKETIKPLYHKLIK